LELNLEKITKNKIFVTVFFMVGMFSIVAFTFLIPTKPQTEQLVFNTHSENAKSAVLGATDTNLTKNDQDIYVQISGAIKNPQVINLKKGSRVFDLINAAGGFTDDASKIYINKILNLARILEDGEKVYIPFSIEELEPDFTNKYTTDNKNTLVNINTANKQQLITLPQVGDSIADKIIDYRTTNGEFKSIDEIKNVSGIGDKAFEEMKNLITI